LALSAQEKKQFELKVLAESIFKGINYQSIQNNWVSGLCPPSEILNARKRNVSETGRLCPQVRGGEGKGDTYSVGTLRKG
jgi:hypothetical protein